MAQEIERKFLVKNKDFKELAKGVFYKQGYLTLGENTVRVRIKGEKAVLTIKSKSKGITRSEFEYEIPIEDANEMLNNHCLNDIIEKYRYKIEYKGKLWEVDEFLGKNKGLLLAEIELESEDEIFEKPDWVTEEVSHDKRYFNAYLSQNSFSTW